MKKLFLILPAIFLAGCATPNESAPDEVGQFPPDYVVSAEAMTNPQETTDNATTEEEATDAKNNDIIACREKNADLSLQMDALEKKLAICKTALEEKPASEAEQSLPAGVNASHLALIRKALLTTEQKEYPFNICGQMGQFIRQSWFNEFSRQLANAKIRFSNGFLETADFFGGCQSTAGKMAFFLGAERNDDLRFYVIKYNLATKKLEPALMLDGAENAVVTEFGKREGPAIAFPADDGRLFHYYYDANIVVEAQE